MLLRAGLAVVFALVFLVAPPFLGATVRAVDVERVVSPGGIEAWLVRDPTNPIIAVNFAFSAGAAIDPASKEGVAEFVSGMLDEGAGELDSKTFQQQLEDLSIGLGFSAGYDNFSGNLKTLTENRDTAFDMLRLALTEPRFDPEPLERIRSQILTILARNAKNPNRIAGREWWQTAFPGHPYGRPQDGTEATVKSIAAADLRAFTKERLGRDNLYIGVVGDITPELLKPLLDKTFGGLRAKAVPGDVPEATPVLSGKVNVVRRPVPQSIVMFGQEGVKRSDPDWYAALIMNRVLGGGGFTSRLTSEVREKRGLAYSISSWLGPLDHAAVLAGSVGTQNARVAESIDIIRAEWERMRDGGVTAAELVDAKTYLTGSYPLRFDSTSSIARVLVAIQRHDLGIDYLDRRNAQIEAVTEADIRRIAKRLLDPARLTFVVVGQPEGLDGG